MFKKLEGDQALVCSGGVYKPVDLYARNGYLYAAVGGGYVKLKADGTTSKDKLYFTALECELALFRDRLGRLAVDAVEGAVELGAPEILKLGSLE